MRATNVDSGVSLDPNEGAAVRLAGYRSAEGSAINLAVDATQPLLGAIGSLSMPGSVLRAGFESHEARAIRCTSSVTDAA